RGIEGEALGLLLTQPLAVVARRPATRDDLETFLVQPLADCGADAAHATGHVCNFLAHSFLLDVLQIPERPEPAMSGLIHSDPATGAPLRGKPPCRRRCTARPDPSWLHDAASRTAASPGYGSPTHRWGGRWRWRRR